MTAEPGDEPAQFEPPLQTVQPPSELEEALTMHGD